MNDTPLLQVNDLFIDFKSRNEVTHAVNGVSFTIIEGKTVAIVGESGSGKSVTALSLTRLLPPRPICSVKGEILYRGENLMDASNSELQQIRGKEIAYIFQEPSTSLNPVFTIGNQISEAIQLHFPKTENVKERVVGFLKQVGIRDSEEHYYAYPHELSGGMQQRVMIAMALACEPKILVADEPTTALDVTIQKQIIDLLKELKQKHTMSIILITHNFGIIKDFADEVLVFYNGNIVEQGPTDMILKKPQHPYTKALINCIPKLGQNLNRLPTIDYTHLG